MTRPPHILVVEDDPSLAEELRRALAALTADVAVAGSAAEAVARAAELDPDVAVIGPRLADELAPQLRASASAVQLVLVTAVPAPESASAADVFAYTRAPWSAAELRETARAALAHAALHRERGRLAAELERCERRSHALLEALPAFVLALDAEGLVTFWNRRLEEATGLPRGQMLGRPGAALIASAGVSHLPTRGRREVLVRWERATVPLPDAETTWTYAVGTDVTAEHELARRTSRAERLAAVGTLAAGLAHEVRNPLNSATLQLDVLARRLDRGESSQESVRPIAAIVREELRRLERLVNDFLAFAHPRALDLRPVDLPELCRTVATLIAPEAEAAGISVVTSLAPEIPVLSADPEGLRQVLLNLVRNATEAMPDGGVLTLSCHATDATVELEVHDTGVGFADETRIFDAFFTTKPQGTGLGLSIVHRIVADHGGNVRVRSHPGDTSFVVSLPRTPAATRAT
jgi:signal transduction histidine kinase